MRRSQTSGVTSTEIPSVACLGERDRRVATRQKDAEPRFLAREFRENFLNTTGFIQLSMVRGENRCSAILEQSGFCGFDTRNAPIDLSDCFNGAWLTGGHWFRSEFMEHRLP